MATEEVTLAGVVAAAAVEPRVTTGVVMTGMVKTPEVE